MGQVFLAAPACGVPGRIPEGPRRLNGLQGGDGVENFVVFGEAEGLELGKHQPAVHPDFKGTAAALDEGSYVVEFVFDRALQTCSIGQVVSFAAVFNRDVHLGPPQQKSMVVSNNEGGILVISPGSVKRLSGSVQSTGPGIVKAAIYGTTAYARPSVQPSSVKVTGHHMTGSDVDFLRLDFRALRFGDRAARVEAATAGRVDG